MANEPTKAYTLKSGAKHHHDGKAVEPGQTIQLTESQFRAFSDKFTAVDAPPPAPLTPPAPPAAGTPGIAQDISAKTKDPNQPLVNKDNLTGPGAPGGTAKL